MEAENEVIEIIEPFLSENGLKIVCVPMIPWGVGHRLNYEYYIFDPRAQLTIEGSKITVHVRTYGTHATGHIASVFDLHHPDSLENLVRYLKGL